MSFQESSLRFRPDAGLMYLIQQTTKQSTDEILGFFYDFGKQVFITGIENMEGKNIRKQIEALYPGTVIPFKMLVKSDKYGPWINGKYEPSKKSGTIEVTFPDNPTYMDTEKLIEMIMETQLLGGSSLPNFEPPKSRTPKLYKDLIQQILKDPKKDE